MKSTIFTKIIDQTEIEVKGSFNEVVDRLSALNGICDSKYADGGIMAFNCYKNGKIVLWDYSLGKRHIHNVCIKGKVMQINNKTIIKLYTIDSKMWRYFLYLMSIVSLFLCCIDIVTHQFKLRDLLVLSFLLFSITLLISIKTEENHNQKQNVELLTREIQKKISIIDRWND